jgi:hypothetical protein
MKSVLKRAEFARLVGVSRPSVTKAVKRGRIQLTGNGIEVTYSECDADAIQASARSLWDSTASNQAHHQARKAQYDNGLRGMTKDQVAEMYRRAKVQKQQAKEELKRLMAESKKKNEEARKEKWRHWNAENRKTEAYKKAAREYQKRIADNLTDTYIVKIIGKRYAHPVLIEMKRDQLLSSRCIKQLKSVLKEKQNEPN